MDRRSYGAVNNEPSVKDYCPSCSLRLKYSSRLNDHFCSQCGFVRSQGKRISFIVDGPNPPDNNKRKGPLSSDSSSAAPTDAEIEMMKIRPLPGQAGMNRVQESLERDRRRNLQYYDNDMKRFAENGYNIVAAEEHIISDNSTFNSDEVRGSFSNMKNNRRYYFR